jgi:competence protein ComGC
MASHKYIQNLFTIIEFVIIFLIIAFLVATTIPGLLRVRKRSQTTQILTLARSSNRLATV